LDARQSTEMWAESLEKRPFCGMARTAELGHARRPADRRLAAPCGAAVVVLDRSLNTKIGSEKARDLWDLKEKGVR
ncbi:MAG TPA: hypothetical protein VGK45_18090, partial [Thermoanaerobaculia bacterium]